MGLAAHLLGIEKSAQVVRSYSDNFLKIFILIVKHITNQGRNPNFYFFRDSNGNEVDLWLNKVEQDPDSATVQTLLKGLENLSSKVDFEAETAHLIFQGQTGPVTSTTQGLENVLGSYSYIKVFHFLVHLLPHFHTFPPVS